MSGVIRDGTASTNLLSKLNPSPRLPPSRNESKLKEGLPNRTLTLETKDSRFLRQSLMSCELQTEHNYVKDVCVDKDIMGTSAQLLQGTEKKKTLVTVTQAEILEKLSNFKSAENALRTYEPIVEILESEKDRKLDNLAIDLHNATASLPVVNCMLNKEIDTSRFQESVRRLRSCLNGESAPAHVVRIIQANSKLNADLRKAELVRDAQERVNIQKARLCSQKLSTNEEYTEEILNEEFENSGSVSITGRIISGNQFNSSGSAEISSISIELESFAESTLNGDSTNHEQ